MILILFLIYFIILWLEKKKKNKKKQLFFCQKKIIILQSMEEEEDQDLEKMFEELKKKFEERDSFYYGHVDKRDEEKEDNRHSLSHVKNFFNNYISPDINNSVVSSSETPSHCFEKKKLKYFQNYEKYVIEEK